MYKAIIFDLDGTLLDTSKDICENLNKTFKKFSLPEISLEKTIEYVGNGARKLVERAVGLNDPGLIEKVYIDFSKRYADCENNLTCLYPYESEVLQNFKNTGVKLAILTNKPQAATERVFAKFLANFGFSIVLGQTEYRPLKPNPASVFEILQSLNVEKKDCLFVGDGEADIQTAKNADIDCACVLWGFRSAKQLKEAGGNIFVSSFRELEKLLIFNIKQIS